MQIETTDALLREIARLRADLSKAEARAQAAANACYHQQMDSQREMMSLCEALAYRAFAAEQAATGWRRAGRLLVAAWRAERTTSHALASALRGLLAAPYGCPMCDAGRLRNPEKTHWPECPYAIARAVLGEDG